MKRLLAVGVLALALAGCNAGAFIRDVQQGAVRLCGFQPAPTMIEAIIKAISGLDVSSVVNYVCQAVNAAPTARFAARRGASIAGAPSFILNGKRILIQGTFVGAPPAGLFVR
jgi:hypothetical protein